MSWPNVVKSWKSNKALTSKANFVKDAIRVIKSRRYDYFRVHAMGEFYNKEYLLKWYNIARACPETKFYAYSKNYNLVKACKSFKPKNFVMVYSVKQIDKSGEFDHTAHNFKSYGFDSVALIADKETAEKYREQFKPSPVCKAGDKPKGYCMGQCTRCAKKNQFIVFTLH
jgi:hypothetical protein